MADHHEGWLLRSLDPAYLRSGAEFSYVVGVCVQYLAARSQVKPLALGLVVSLAASFAQAQPAPDPVPLPGHQLIAPAEQPRSTLKFRAGTNEAEPLSHHHYTTKDGHEVHSPARSTHDQLPAGASAKCRDGTYFFSRHRRGSCSRHSGVSNWL